MKKIISYILLGLVIAVIFSVILINYFIKTICEDVRISDLDKVPICYEVLEK